MQSLINWWYATGPVGKPFRANDPAFNVHRVVDDSPDSPLVVLVENAAGQRFYVPRSLVESIAAP